jgi:hypothetical protein
MGELEQQVMKHLGSAISEAVKGKLSVYDSPLQKIAEQVVAAHAPEIKAAMDSLLVATINGDEFKQALKDAFTHKLAKVAVSKLDGAFEKSFASMFNDPVTKARMVLAIVPWCPRRLTSNSRNA